VLLAVSSASPAAHPASRTTACGTPEPIPWLTRRSCRGAVDRVSRRRCSAAECTDRVFLARSACADHPLRQGHTAGCPARHRAAPDASRRPGWHYGKATRLVLERPLARLAHRPGANQRRPSHRRSGGHHRHDCRSDPHLALRRAYDGSISRCPAACQQQSGPSDNGLPGQRGISSTIDMFPGTNSGLAVTLLVSTPGDAVVVFFSGTDVSGSESLYQTTTAGKAELLTHLQDKATPERAQMEQSLPTAETSSAVIRARIPIA
jgi:hypothetical protein